MHKRILLLLTLAATAPQLARAQSDVSLGVKAGASLASLVGEQATNTESLVGFQAGIFANIGFTNMLAFQPEVLYSQKGAKFTSLPNHTLRLNYVDVPLLLHVNADGLFFEAGPQVGFLVAAKDEYGSLTFDRKSRYNTTDFGYIAGLGYQRKTGPGLGVRYNGGFSKIEKPTTVGNAEYQPNIRNSVFQFYATFSFGGR